MLVEVREDHGFATIVGDYLARHNVIVQQLYHYTSAQSLLGILNSRELWLSEHSYLRDYSEVTNGVKTLIDLMKNKRGIEYIDAVYNNDQQDVKLALLSNLCYHTFVFSLTEDDDSKSQWSEYGDSYMGICLGFDHDKILNEVLNHKHAIDFKTTQSKLHYTERGLFSKVIYDDLEKEKLLCAILDRSIEVAEGLPKSIVGTEKMANFQQIFTETLFVILKLIPLFKNSSFSVEKEHRIVIQFPIRGLRYIRADLGDFDYRIANNVIMPYYRFKFKTLDQIVKSLRVGPKYGDIKHGITIEELCRKMGVTGVTVDVSRIPIQ